MSATARETPTRSTDPELPLGMRQKAIDLDLQVEREVIGHRRVAEREEFLDAFLPCPMDPEMIFNSVREREYKGDPGQGSWNQLPKKPTVEKSIYGPFVRIATAIQDSSVKMYDSGRAESEKTYVRGSWVNCADKNMASSREESARVRPDIGLYTRTQTIEALIKSIIDLDEIIKEGRRKVGKRDLSTLETQRTREVFWHLANPPL